MEYILLRIPGQGKFFKITSDDKESPRGVCPENISSLRLLHSILLQFLQKFQRFQISRAEQPQTKTIACTALKLAPFFINL